VAPNRRIGHQQEISPVLMLLFEWDVIPPFDLRTITETIGI